MNNLLLWFAALLGLLAFMKIIGSRKLSTETDFALWRYKQMPINIVSELQAGMVPDAATTQLFLMDVENFLDSLPQEPIFDLVVTSPPYNIGKEYENQMPLTNYVAWQKRSSKRYIRGSKITAASAGK